MYKSLSRARNAERKESLGHIRNALETYLVDYGFFPPSTEDGKILACEKDGVDYESIVKMNKKLIDLEIDYNDIFRGCEWGEDPLGDVFDKDYPPYLETLPIDPFHEKGVSFYYQSSGRRYQVYAALEGKNEELGQEEIEKRSLPCGNKICNFGRALGNTPLDKSLEEYENELRQKANE